MNYQLGVTILDWAIPTLVILGTCAVLGLLWLCRHDLDGDWREDLDQHAGNPFVDAVRGERGEGPR